MTQDVFGLTLAAGFVGMFLGTMLFGMGSDRFGRRTAFIIIGAAGAVFVWYLRRALPESPRWLEGQGRHDEAEAIMSKIERQVQLDTGPLPKPAYSKTPVAERGHISKLMQPAYRTRTLLMLGFHLLQTIGIYGFANWVPTFLLSHGVMAVFFFTGSAMALCALLVAVWGPKTNAVLLEELSG